MGSAKKYRKLVSAIKKKDYHQVKFLLEVRYPLPDKFDLNHVDDKGRTLLHLASELGAVNISQFLIAHGAEVEVEDVYGRTPLSTAASYGDMELTALYLEKGADPNGTSRASIPLINAAGHGHHAVVALLLEHGADANIVHQDGDSPLIFAAMSGRYFTAKTLLEHGASTEAQTDGTQTDVDGCPYSQRTPLHWAIQEEYLEIVQLLLEHGADVEAEDEHGITPLSAAVAECDTTLFAQLLEKAVNINGSATAQSPLEMAVAYQRHEKTELLIARGADVNIADSDDGETLLITATRNRDLRMMKLLLDAGADTSISNEADETALDVAKAGKFKKGVALIKGYTKA